MSDAGEKERSGTLAAGGCLLALTSAVAGVGFWLVWRTPYRRARIEAILEEPSQLRHLGWGSWSVIVLLAGLIAVGIALLALGARREVR